MSKFFKDLLVAPFGVKISFCFLAFFALVACLANPGPIIFTTLLFVAMYNFVDWLVEREDKDE